MFDLIFFSVLTHAARPACRGNLLGHKTRRAAAVAPTGDAAEVTRQTTQLELFRRGLRASLSTALSEFAGRGFIRLIDVEPDDQPPALRRGWAPLVDGEHEPWLTVPGKLLVETPSGPRPGPFATAVLKFCADQALTAEVYRWIEKEHFDGVAYGQWYRVSARVTSPTLPPVSSGRARPEWAGSPRRREPDERYFSLMKGQPATYLRIGWR